jgi:S-formylglutathione hydrolase FrmB
MGTEDHPAIANYLCALASSYGIECAVVAKPGEHTFPSAATAFADALPWLASKIGTPGVAAVGLPGAPQPGVPSVR